MKGNLFVGALLGAFLLAACGKDDSNPLAFGDPALSSYALPGDTLFPEGIVYNAANKRFFTGSVAGGDVISVDAVTGAAMVFAPGANQARSAANGLKLDDYGRLWIAGGASSTVSVLDPSGNLLRRWDMAALFGGRFINDCISDGRYMYFTDSRMGQIYRADVTEAAPATMELWMTYNRQQVPGDSVAVNANGIVVTPDNRYLLMVVSSTGKLYRIGIADRSLQEVALNGPLIGGDGMLLEGNRLFVCRNAANTIVPVTMNNDYTQGNVGAGFGEGLLFPTTIARAGSYLLVVNGQLNKRASKDAQLPFTVSRVRIP